MFNFHQSEYDKLKHEIRDVSRSLRELRRAMLLRAIKAEIGKLAQSRKTKTGKKPEKARKGNHRLYSLGLALSMGYILAAIFQKTKQTFYFSCGIFRDNS